MKQSLLLRLTNQFQALDHLLHSLTEDQIRQRPPSGKWSIFENLAHLGRYQEVFSDRLQKINAKKSPLFDRYVSDDDPEFIVWTKLSFTELVGRLSIERSRLNAFLSILPDDQLIRVGLHPTYGVMTIEGWTESFLLHEAHHFYTILKLGGELRSVNQPMGL